jgi:2-polyprenyl-3-methyl-5-hydroxy-6-metoxy-1,4-benzoquinol methylase
MLTPAVLAFVRSSLPAPPVRVLEVGAGSGELAAALAAAGYEVTAIDPAAEPGSQVRPETLLDASGSFDAAVAVVSLHHVDPLEESCAHLASLLEIGAPLVIDEIDLDRCDDRATRWWLGQRHALGAEEDQHAPSDVLEHLRAHIHPLTRVHAALRPYFDLGEPVRGPYLHRWGLRAGLEGIEVDLIAEGTLPAVGVRQVAIRTAVDRR